MWIEHEIQDELYPVKKSEKFEAHFLDRNYISPIIVGFTKNDA